MLRRVRVSLCAKAKGFDFAGGLPAAPETAQERKDARNYVLGSEFDHVSRGDEEVEFLLPKGWRVHRTEPTYSGGNRIVELNCGLDLTGKPQECGILPHVSSQGFAVVSVGLPETDFSDLRRGQLPGRTDFLKAWLESLSALQHTAQEGQRRYDYFEYQLGPPCTPVEVGGDSDEAHGSYAWAKSIVNGNKFVNYYRLLPSGDYSHVYLVQYYANPEAFAHHLAERWYGNHLLNSVVSMV